MSSDPVIAIGLLAVIAAARALAGVSRSRRERLALSTYERCRDSNDDPAGDIALILRSFHKEASSTERPQRRPRPVGGA